MSAPPPNNGVKLSATGRAVLGQREEQGKLPAALFATVIHLGFFAVIIFGVSWQVKVPVPLQAEIWRDLPMMNAPAPMPTPPPDVEAEPPPPKLATPIKPVPPVTTRADIALKEKKERQEKQKLEQQQRDDKKKTEVDKKKTEETKRKTEEEKLRAEADAREAAVASARQRAVNDYAAKIGSLIRNRANIPESVIGRPIVEVQLRLLVNGAVLDAQIVRPSGNRAFDDAVERAINGIRQWPVPDDPTIFGKRRELNLRIEHER